MNTIESGTDVSLTNLTPELKASSVSNSAKGDSAEKIQKEVRANSIEENTIEQDVEEKQAPLTSEQLDKVAQQLQDFVGEMNRGLEFSVDKDSGRDVIKVIDKSSGDLVKQYPSEEVLTLVSKLSDMVGGFVDAKV